MSEKKETFRIGHKTSIILIANSGQDSTRFQKYRHILLVNTKIKKIIKDYTVEQLFKD